MRGVFVAMAMAIFAQSAYSESTEQLEKFGWWTVFRAVDPATGKQACSAQHVGGWMTLKASSLTIAGVPWNSTFGGESLAISFDDKPFTPRFNEAAGITRHFGALTLEGAAYTQAIASQKLVISVGAVQSWHDMRGVMQALQLLKNACHI